MHRVDSVFIDKGPQAKKDLKEFLEKALKKGNFVEGIVCKSPYFRMECVCAYGRSQCWKYKPGGDAIDAVLLTIRWNKRWIADYGFYDLNTKKFVVTGSDGIKHRLFQYLLDKKALTPKGRGMQTSYTCKMPVKLHSFPGKKIMRLRGIQDLLFDRKPESCTLSKLMNRNIRYKIKYLVS